MSNRTIFRKELNQLAFQRQNFYHRIKYIIFKSFSSKYNIVFHYHLYLIRGLPVYWNTSLDQQSSSGQHYINTQEATKSQWAHRASCIPVYRDTLWLAVLGIHGSSGVCPGSGGSWLTCALTSILVPEAPLFWEMPTGSEAFLGLPGTSRLQPCARTNLKKGLVPHWSSWWDGWQIQLTHQASSNLRGPSPQALTLLGRFIAWRLRRLFLREYWQGLRYFWGR